MDNIEFEPECKPRGMEACLHFRGAASVALEREFTRMVKEHRKTIYTVCYFFSKDADEVNDLFQEILINLWKQRKTVEYRIGYTPDRTSSQDRVVSILLQGLVLD